MAKFVITVWYSTWNRGGNDFMLEEIRSARDVAKINGIISIIRQTVFALFASFKLK